ncbi:MAG: hypothetical protein QW451_01495 [Candidatus Aenigmatarchaeota archaeon]
MKTIESLEEVKNLIGKRVKLYIPGEDEILIGNVSNVVRKKVEGASKKYATRIILHDCYRIDKYGEVHARKKASVPYPYKGKLQYDICADKEND